MLLNLKLLYVKWRSFPQARMVTDLLLALTPNPMPELRDRGLLAYHMNDFASALRDLEDYLRRSKTRGDVGEDQREEDEKVWEHVKALRRRVAGAQLAPPVCARERHSGASGQTAQCGPTARQVCRP